MFRCGSWQHTEEKMPGRRRQNSIRQELWAIPKELAGRKDPVFFDDGDPDLPVDDEPAVQFADFEPSDELDTVIIH
jgi:hypothetical protein